MGDTWKVNVVIVVSAVNENFAPNASILAFDGQLPHISLLAGSKSPIIVEEWIEENLGFKSDWVGRPLMKGVFEGEELDLVYYLVVPQELRLKFPYHWVKLNDLDNLSETDANIIRFAIL